MLRETGRKWIQDHSIQARGAKLAFHCFAMPELLYSAFLVNSPSELRARSGPTLTLMFPQGRPRSPSRQIGSKFP